MYFNDDKSFYRGYFENGKKKGKGVESYPNNYNYDGFFENNRRNGVGIMHYNNGMSYIGEWVDG